jgi:hypothetical protein
MIKLMKSNFSFIKYSSLGTLVRLHPCKSHDCPSRSNRQYVVTLYQHGGRAIAQSVSRCLPTAAARVRARVWPSGMGGGQSGAGAGFLRVRRFPLPVFTPPNSSSS